MFEQQVTDKPFGIRVFGSAVLRVMPDVAVVRFSVSQLRPNAREAFQAVREIAQQIQTYLSNAQFKDAGSSRISLHEDYRNLNGESQFYGYNTSVEFRVLVTDLDRVEELLAGVIDVGASSIQSVVFQTTRLKEMRSEARRQATVAAREKAQVYCEAAGVELGEVIHIEDMNPDFLTRFRGHTQLEAPSEDDGGPQAFNPGSIEVAGSVTVAFKIRDKNNK